MLKYNGCVLIFKHTLYIIIDITCLILLYINQFVDYTYEDITVVHENSLQSDNFDDGGDVSTATTSVTNNKRSSSVDVSHTKRPHHNYSYEKQQSSNELFGKYMATSLDALPPQLAIQAQKDIHDILIKYKLIDHNYNVSQDKR